MRRLLFLVSLCLIGFAKGIIDESVVQYVPNIVVSSNFSDFVRSFRCKHELMELGKKSAPTCLVPEKKCSRMALDGKVNGEIISRFQTMATKAMKTRPSYGGATLLDVNTGSLRDTMGLSNIFHSPSNVFTESELDFFGEINRSLKELFEFQFQVSNLFFTSPSLLVRLDGNRSWVPRGSIDEYWTTKADMNSTASVHYSGILFLSTFSLDFTGGRLLFKGTDPDDPSIVRTEDIIEPKKGRLMLFTSGPENTYHFERLSSGQMFMYRFWFTCQYEKRFVLFENGNMHLQYSEQVRAFEMKKKRALEEEWEREENELLTERDIENNNDNKESGAKNTAEPKRASQARSKDRFAAPKDPFQQIRNRFQAPPRDL